MADGGIPTKYDAQGNVAEESAPKEVRPFRSPEGPVVSYALEESIVTDFALVHAVRGDLHGNLVFNKAARQFSPRQQWPAESALRRSKNWSNQERSTLMMSISRDLCTPDP